MRRNSRLVLELPPRTPGLPGPRASLLVLVVVVLPLVEPLLVQILRHEVRDLNVVQVRKGEVSVAEDADIGQAQELGIASMAVQRSHKQHCHLSAGAPEVRSGNGVHGLWDVVPVDQLDGDLGQLLKLGSRYRRTGYGA